MSAWHLLLLSHKNDFLISKVYIQQGLKKQRAAVSSEFLQLDLGFLFFFMIFFFFFSNFASKHQFFTTPKPISTVRYSYNVRFRSLCRHFSFREPLAPVLTVRRKKMSSRLPFSSLNPMTFFPVPE